MIPSVTSQDYPRSIHAALDNQLLSIFSYKRRADVMTSVCQTKLGSKGKKKSRHDSLPCKFTSPSMPVFIWHILCEELQP